MTRLPLLTIVASGDASALAWIQSIETIASSINPDSYRQELLASRFEPR
jgi:hypothetical protein